MGSTFERERLSHGCADGFCWDVHREAGCFLEEERISGWEWPLYPSLAKRGCLTSPTGRQTFCLHQSMCCRQQLGGQSVDQTQDKEEDVETPGR